MGRRIMIESMPEMKSGGNWIQHAVNKKHVGFCTPMTKSTCTPRRKAFAMTMKKHHGFHEYGGPANPFHPLAQYAAGGFGPGNPDEEVNAMNVPAATQPVNPSSQYNSPYTTGVAQPTSYGAGTADPNAAWRAGMTDEEAQANIDAGSQPAPGPKQKGQGMQKVAAYANGFNNLLGAGLMTAANFANRKAEKNNAAYNRSLGMTSNMPLYQNPGGYGDYTQQGMFRTTQMVPTNPGMYLPGHAQYGGSHYTYGGMQYEHGGTYELDDMEIARLKKLGYKIQHL